MFITVTGSQLGHYTLALISKKPESARDPDDILTGRHTEKTLMGSAEIMAEATKIYSFTGTFYLTM